MPSLLKRQVGVTVQGPSLEDILLAPEPTIISLRVCQFRNRKYPGRPLGIEALPDALYQGNHCGMASHICDYRVPLTNWRKHRIVAILRLLNNDACSFLCTGFKSGMNFVWLCYHCLNMARLVPCVVHGKAEPCLQCLRSTNQPQCSDRLNQWLLISLIMCDNDIFMN